MYKTIVKKLVKLLKQQDINTFIITSDDEQSMIPMIFLHEEWSL